MRGARHRLTGERSPGATPSSIGRPRSIQRQPLWARVESGLSKLGSGEARWVKHEWLHRALGRIPDEPRGRPGSLFTVYIFTHTLFLGLSQYLPVMSLLISCFGLIFGLILFCAFRLVGLLLAQLYWAETSMLFTKGNHRLSTLHFGAAYLANGSLKTGTGKGEKEANVSSGVGMRRKGSRCQVYMDKKGQYQSSNSQFSEEASL